MLVGWRQYEDGKEVAWGTTLDQALAARGGGQFTWLRLGDPRPDDVRRLAAAFDLAPLAVEDLAASGQRPKLAHHGEDIFVVLRPAIYVDPTESVRLGELHVYQSADFVITTRHGDIGGLEGVEARLKADEHLCALGPRAVLYAACDQVVEDYEPVLSGLEQDIEEIELAVFDDAQRPPTERMYALIRQVLDFHRASAGLQRPLEMLAHGHIGAADGGEDALRPYFRDVVGDARVVVERLDAFRELLQGALQANLSLIGLQENRDQRKISAWAAMALVPTILGSIWGMNVGLPLQDTAYGFPALIAAMGASLAYLYWRFRRNDWL